MRTYAGLDVSLAETSVCVVDEDGRIIKEAKVASEPEPLATWLGALGLSLARVGLETGAVVGLTFIASIDDPDRFAKSRSVAAMLGMVPRKHQSGQLDRNGRITKTGDASARSALYEAAHVMLHWVKRWSGLTAWATKVAQRQGNKRATVALARKMAVVMHRMWVDGTTFRWTTAEAPATAA